MQWFLLCMRKKSPLTKFYLLQLLVIWLGCKTAEVFALDCWLLCKPVQTWLRGFKTLNALKYAAWVNNVKIFKEIFSWEFRLWFAFALCLELSSYHDGPGRSSGHMPRNRFASPSRPTIFRTGWEWTKIFKGKKDSAGKTVEPARLKECHRQFLLYVQQKLLKWIQASLS